jgi:hypothetical protein
MEALGVVFANGQAQYTGTAEAVQQLVERYNELEQQQKENQA